MSLACGLHAAFDIGWGARHGPGLGDSIAAGRRGAGFASGPIKTSEEFTLCVARSAGRVCCYADSAK
jgi:hypothetical protein